MRNIASEIVGAEGAELEAAKIQAEDLYRARAGPRRQCGRQHATPHGPRGPVRNAALQTGSRQRRVSREREYLSVTLASIGDAVIATDVTGRITLMNAVASQLTGWRPDEALGRDIHDIFVLIKESTKARIEQPLERVLHGGQRWNCDHETLLMRRDGVDTSDRRQRRRHPRRRRRDLRARCWCFATSPNGALRRRRCVDSEQRYREAAEREPGARRRPRKPTASRTSSSPSCRTSCGRRSTPCSAGRRFSQRRARRRRPRPGRWRPSSATPRLSSGSSKTCSMCRGSSRGKFAIDRRPVESARGRRGRRRHASGRRGRPQRST